MKIMRGLLLILCLALPVSAQKSAGVLAGINLANLNIDPDDGLDFKNRTAFGFGGVFDICLNDNASIRFEPMYIQKGSKLEEGDAKLEYKVGYIDVPIMVKYSVDLFFR